MRNFISSGNTLELTAPAGGVVSGGGYLIGVLFVVATHDAAAGKPFTGNRTGIYTLPKKSGEAWNEGAALYWDNTAKECTTVATNNTKIGCSPGSAASGATSADVLLYGHTA